MNFTLAGFREKDGVRQFSFKCISTGGLSSMVTVRADVNVARKHEIRLQDLPLLCIRFLASMREDQLSASVTLTEAYMISIETAAKNEAEKKQQRPSRRPSPATGQAWRQSPLPSSSHRNGR